MATYRILSRRGLAADLPTLAAGEPGWTTDTRKLYVGSSVGNVEITGPHITPEQYGAVGDGVTVDTVALQAAINAAWASQGVVMLGAKTYKTGSLALPADDYHTVAIVGSNATGLWEMDEAPCLYFYLADGTNFITITNPATAIQAFYRFENINFRGPDHGGATTTSGHGLYMNAANVTATCYFRNVSINGFMGSGKAGLYLYDAEYSHFDSVDVTQCDYGLYVATSTNAATFTNVMAQYNRIGIYIAGCTNQTWISPTIQGNTEDGLYINGLDSATFIAPHFEDNNTSDTSGKYGLRIAAPAAGGNTNINFINTYLATVNDQIYMAGGAGINSSIKFDGIIGYGGDPWVTLGDGNNIGIYFYGGALTTARIVNANNCPIFMHSTTAAYDLDFPAFLGNKHWTHGTVAPASGTWAVGDVCWNTGPAVGEAPGWVCTTAGTPGTWAGIPNLGYVNQDVTSSGTPTFTSVTAYDGAKSLKVGGYSGGASAKWIANDDDYIGFLTLFGSAHIIKAGNALITGTFTATLGTSATNTLGLSSGTPPASSPADMAQLYSADAGGVAGQAGPHIRTEGGGIVGFRADTGTTLQYTYQADALADDGTVTLPDATSGMVLVSCNAEAGMWLVQTDGTVTKISGSTNTANTDSDGNLCVYDGGTGGIVKNRLGTTGEIRVVYFYN